MDYTFEHEYLDLLHYILDKGEDRADRTGTGTRAIFATSLNIDLADGFPLLTTKKLPWRSIVAELLWFIEGSEDERRLAELTHGTRDPAKETIWTANAKATSGSSFKPSFEGDLGRIYGVQWRAWRSAKVESYEDYLNHHDGSGGTTYFGAKVQQTQIDQLAQVVHKLRTNPTDRRIILTAWNPGELNQMALPPCHMFAQFYLSNDSKLSCQMYQRSVDSFLGLPFNIASYALLTHLLAYTVGAEAGTLSMVLGDTHIYKDHVVAVEKQLLREPTELPRLRITSERKEVDEYTVDDFQLVGYNPQAAIPAKMSA